ncbi:MAG: hypothetical protein ACTHJG_01395 [Rhodanobacteraceae bacterium]
MQPFDRHRVGEYGKDRRCMSVAEMQAAGFIRNAVGFWCERASAEHATRPRALVFAGRRAPSARVSPHQSPRAQKPSVRKAGAA